LFVTESLPPNASAGEQSPTSPAPSLQPTVSFWQSRAIAPAAGDHAPSGSHCWEQSPTSPAPSLPPAEFGFSPPEHPGSSHYGHDDASTKPRHSIATQSTTLTSSSSLQSHLSCSAQTSQSESSRDGLSIELPARRAQHRQLGCLLGSSIHPKEAGRLLGNSIHPKEESNSRSASSTRQPCCEGEKWPWHGSLRDAPRGPAGAELLGHSGSNRACLKASCGIVNPATSSSSGTKRCNPLPTPSNPLFFDIATPRT